MHQTNSFAYHIRHSDIQRFCRLLQLLHGFFVHTHVKYAGLG